MSPPRWRAACVCVAPFLTNLHPTPCEQRRSCFGCSPFCKGSFPVLGSDSEEEAGAEAGYRALHGPRVEASQRRAADGFVIRTRASLEDTAFAEARDEAEAGAVRLVEASCGG